MELSAGMTVCRFIKSRAVFPLFLFACFCSCNNEQSTVSDTLPFYNTAQFDAEWISPSDPSYKKIHTIDTFALSNQLGHTITRDSLNGHIYVANFFFTICSGICPKMVSNLAALQDSFANDDGVKLISFTVMPWVDSVAKLNEYGLLHNVNPSKWWLLTGSKERIYTLGRQSYFAEKGLGLKKDSSEFLHTESMLLIDKKGRIRGIYNATQRVDIERVMDDIKTLKKE